MLSSIRAIVSAVEEKSDHLLTLVNELHRVLQQQPPEAGEAWNCACLLWRAIVQVADAMCTKAGDGVHGELGAGSSFTLEQWQKVYGLASDLLQLSPNHVDCGQEITVPASLHAMQAQLQLFDAEVHASLGDWETTWRSLQTLGATAQSLVSNDNEDRHHTALLFQLFILQLQAAWKLGHKVGAEELYTLCTEVIFSISESGSQSDWMPLLQFLLMKHIEQADTVLMGSGGKGRLTLTWNILQQAEKCLQTDTVHLVARASDEGVSWAEGMLSQVCYLQNKISDRHGKAVKPMLDVTSWIQVRTRQVLTVIMIMANTGADPEMLELMKTPVAVLQELLGKLSQCSPLQTLAPAIASLFVKQEEMDIGELSKLLAHQWITEEVFAACLNRAVLIDTSKCLAILGQAMERFHHSTSLVACLWNAQVNRAEDADAVASFLKLPHARTVLKNDTNLQARIFVKLHSWTQQLLGSEKPSIASVENYLKACLSCAQPQQLPILHHTWALAALASGQLELSLEHLDLLLKSNEAAVANSPQRATENSRKHMAGRLLRFKVLCMMDDSDALLAELDNIMKQTALTSEDISVISKDLYHECACSTVQTVAIHLLAAMTDAGSQLHEAPCGDGEVLELCMAKAVLLTLALPAHVFDTEITAAQAIQQHLVGCQLSWGHFDSHMCEKAVELSILCEKSVRKQDQEPDGQGSHHGGQQWKDSDLHDMASHFFNMAVQAMQLQCSRKAVLLWRSAGCLWSSMARASVEHLRRSHEAYLLASEGTLTIATTEEQQDQGTVALATVLFARATEQQRLLKQHMFYVESQDDHHCCVRSAICELQLGMIKDDPESLSRTVEALIELAPELNVLLLAASKLRQGYPSLADSTLKSALQRVQTISERPNTNDPLGIAKAGRCLLDSAQSDHDRIQTLELMLDLARGPCMAGCFPELEAHYICAKAFNIAAAHMRSRNTELAQSFMTLASDLADATDCKVVTSDMCRAAAKKFSAGFAET